MKNTLFKITITFLITLALAVTPALALPTVVLNDQIIDVTPVVEQEHIILPVRTVFNALDGTVHWNNVDKTATANLGTSTIRITAGGPVYYNNQPIGYLIGPQIINGQLMVSGNLLAELINARVQWDKAGGRIIISTGQTASTDQAGKTGTWPLTILHTNDTHAYLDTPEAGSLVARRATAINAIRADVSNTLLLDAGDVFSGTPYFSFFKGHADLAMMHLLGYDAMSLGNHEFDEGPQTLAEFIRQAQFPLLSANIDASNEPALRELAYPNPGIQNDEQDDFLGGHLYPAVILNVNGEQVGIIGLTTEDTSIGSRMGENIVLKNSLDTARKVVEDLEKRGINKIILLSHLGWNQDLELAQQVEGIDVVVGGHSHTLPEVYPTVVKKGKEPVLVVQAGSYGQYLGQLNVTFDENGTVTNWYGQLIDLLSQNADGEFQYAEAQDVKNSLAPYKEQLGELYNTVIGQTACRLNGDRPDVRMQETNLGNLVADAMLEKAAPLGATICIINGGNFRTSIEAGDITMGKLLNAMPFTNTLVVLELTGAQIMEALENGVSRVESGGGCFPQVSGIRFTYDLSQPVGHRIASIEVKSNRGYQSIDLEAVYKVAVNSFLSEGNDGYQVFKQAISSKDMGYMQFDVVMEYIAKHSPINPQTEGRIKGVNLHLEQ